MSIQLSPIGLLVRTESGQALGKVTDVQIEPDTQSVVIYVVKPARLFSAMVSEPLLIHRTQVVAFTDEHLIVEDGTSAKPQAAYQPAATA